MRLSKPGFRGACACLALCACGFSLADVLPSLRPQGMIHDLTAGAGVDETARGAIAAHGPREPGQSALRPNG